MVGVGIVPRAGREGGCIRVVQCLVGTKRVPRNQEYNTIESLV